MGRLFFCCFILILASSGCRLDDNQVKGNVGNGTLPSTSPTQIEKIEILSPIPSSISADGMASFTVQYTDASSITLTPQDISLQGDTVGCQVAVLGEGLLSREIVVSNCWEINGSLFFEFLNPTALDQNGNPLVVANLQSPPLAVSNSTTPSQDTVCTGGTTNSWSGSLTDSGGVSGNYSNSEDCSYTISVPSGMKINFFFKSFGIEGHPTCIWDYLRFYDGPNTGSPALPVNGKNLLCSSGSEPVDFTSPNNEVTVQFHSDGGVTGSGFEFSWVATNKDLVPDNFSFTSVSNADFNGDYIASSALTGFDGKLIASVSTGDGNPQIKNLTKGGNFTSNSVTVEAGDTIQVKITAGPHYGISRGTTVSIGGVSANYYVSTPVPPKFADVRTGITTSTLYVESVNLTGNFSGSMNVSVSGHASAQVRNFSTGSSYGSSVVASAGDQIDVQMTTSGDLADLPFSADIIYDDGNGNTSSSRWTIIGCPAGFIHARAMPGYTSVDFCVMKYEAKNVGGIATSQESLNPWTNLSANSAFSNCAALGADYHLITNDEWMSLARDIERKSENWSGGHVGNGCIFRGNNYEANDCGYGVDAKDSGAARNTKARLTLSTGEEIWDLAGNVWEFVDWDGSDGAFTLMSPAPLCDGKWRQYSDGYDCAGSFDVANLFAPATYLSNSYGVGILALDSSGTKGGIKRGGHHSAMTASGIYSALTHLSGGSSGSTDGFRCVYNP